eukprot:403352553
MVCSDTMENQPKLFKNFKYGLCKFDQSVCGESRDIFVSNYQQAFNSNYFSTTDTCLWRFIAVSQLEKDTRQIRIRVTDQKRIKIYASILQKTNSAKIVNDLGKEWNVITEVNQGVLAGNLGQESGLIVANITNYVYIVAVPEITGSFVNFEYILSDELTYPSLNDTNSTSSSTSSSSSGTSDEGAFNNYTRKLLSYLLSSIFGLVFIIGLFQIYRQFFSKEAKIRDLIVRDLRKKRQNELMSRQRQQKELKFMTREEYARFTQEGQRLQIEIQHQQHEKIQDALDEQKWQQQKKNNEKGNFNDTENQLDDYMESDANYDNEDVFNGKYKQTDQSLNMLTVNMTQGDLLGGNNLTQNNDDSFIGLSNQKYDKTILERKIKKNQDNFQSQYSKANVKNNSNQNFSEDTKISDSLTTISDKLKSNSSGQEDPQSRPAATNKGKLNRQNNKLTQNLAPISQLNSSQLPLKSPIQNDNSKKMNNFENVGRQIDSDDFEVNNEEIKQSNYDNEQEGKNNSNMRQMDEYLYQINKRLQKKEQMSMSQMPNKQTDFGVDDAGQFGKRKKNAFND